MTDDDALILVRRAALTVYGVDPASRDRRPITAEARAVAMMALHDEFVWTQTRATIALGKKTPGTFCHARLRLVRTFERDPDARVRAAIVIALIDRERAMDGAI